MSSIHAIAERSSAPFVGLPDPRFFYGNLANLEVLAGLRFGIEARKGLILLTGGPGTGKSTVLHELRRELDAKAACILVTDPHLRLTEILRLILRHLGVAGAIDEDATAIDACRAALAAHAENNRILSVAFDDAEHLPDETIETLTQHFLAKGFDPAGNLLQIVLAGRPELRKRMFMAPLSALKTQVEIECRLRPLHSRAVEHYIKHRLTAAELPVDTFDQDALALIATHSHGRLDLVNAICHRALEETPANVTASTVNGVVKDLELSRSDAPTATGEPKPNVTAFLAPSAISDVWSPTVIAAKIPERGTHTERKRARYRSVAVALLSLATLGIAALWLSSEASRTQLANWTVALEKSARVKRDHGLPSGNQSEPVSGRASEAPFQAPVGESLDQTLTDSSDSSANGETTSRASGTPPPLDRARLTNDQFVQAPTKPSENRIMQRESRIERTSDRELAEQIGRALANRALRGVSVSIKDGEAVLEGLVASEAQKQVAERTAREVFGVRSVVNRVAIE